MAFTYEQIHIDRIGGEMELFVIDYKQSCKHLQAFPSRCGGQPRQIFSAEALAGCLLIAHQNITFLKKYPTGSNSSALNTVLCRPLPPNDANYYTNHAGTIYTCWITSYSALVQQCKPSNCL